MTDDKLFTPGPLSTSRTVKESMLRDYGSREDDFVALVREIRAELLALAEVGAGFEAVPMQGSGTFALEAAISTLIPTEAKILTVINGAYGARLAQIAELHGIEVERMELGEDEPADPSRIAATLAGDPSISHVTLVHCETTTGLLNPLVEVGGAVAAAGRTFMVDAMSSFGGIPLSMETASIDVLVSSSNKCIEGVPGFAFVLCRTALLEESDGRARTLSLDLVSQWRGLEKNGQFRFTPPTHVMVAFRQALRELAEEGGVEARAARYRANHARLVEGMRELGFEEYLPSERQAWIITTFREPADRPFDFERVYRELRARGLIIYPGKLTREKSFRIGSIGHLTTEDIDRLLSAMREICA